MTKMQTSLNTFTEKYMLQIHTFKTALSVVVAVNESDNLRVVCIINSSHSGLVKFYNATEPITVQLVVEEVRNISTLLSD